MEVKRFLSVIDHLLNHSVHDSVSEQIGKIKDIFIDPDTNRPIFAILATGGFLGMGTDHIVVPWHTLEFNTNSHDIKLTINRHHLDNAPKLDTEKLRNADREEMDKMFRFYGEGDFDAGKGTNVEASSFAQPDPNEHQAYEGSAKITGEEPKNKSDQAAENVDEKAKGFRQE